MYVEHGLELPDTPVMALHRGRIDLIEAHLSRDPDLLTAEAVGSLLGSVQQNTPASEVRSDNR